MKKILLARIGVERGKVVGRGMQREVAYSLSMNLRV